MSTNVLYARTTPEQKAAVDAYAASKGLKMNAAVVDLVSRGLASVAEEDATTVTTAPAAAAVATVDDTDTARTIGIIVGTVGVVLGLGALLRKRTA